jgi:inhibitor of growth protein 3
MSVLADGSTAYDSTEAGEPEDSTALSHRSASRNSSSRQQYTSGLGVPPLVHDHPNIHGTSAQGNSTRPGSDDDSEGPEDEDPELLEPEIGIEGEGFDEGDDGQQLYCYCNRVSFGNMIGCDDEACQKEWFHLQCVGLSTPPKGEWYCDECQIRREALAKTQAKKRRT